MKTYHDKLMDTPIDHLKAMIKRQKNVIELEQGNLESMERAYYKKKHNEGEHVEAQDY